MSKPTLPIIDLSPFLNDSNKVIDVAKQIDDACRNWGFFYIVGHPISRERIAKLRSMANEFFSLPMEKKMEIDIKQSRHHRGYGEFKAEQLDPSAPFDYKETFDMGCNLPEDHPDVVAGKPLRGPNRHTTHVEGWAELLEEHYRDMQKLALLLLRALALAIGIKEDFFVSCFVEPLSVFRMIHYPAMPAEQTQRVVCGEHTDYGILTLLYQDSCGGLQVRDIKGEWIDATPVEGSFVVNIGDMMAMWSNGRYKSTSHRVLNPGVDRISMPFFCEPHPDTLIQCLENCHSPENPPMYPPVKAAEWLRKRFAATYAYRKMM
ncbi:putative thymine-7-hydroxylase [Trypanosoma theileri]|uniref:Putative thymine-7-hydroxylase n=1 Tax=Trypanosoma theileri TaxID=67003 RepID=A0A1X0P0P9_9TRYP|nr:putative thymine-7-hydroxylase [Trypanosoma theileri]ORC90079.1 putative thymine-7-hydroxylase [Trypanosoma theileri]